MSVRTNTLTLLAFAAVYLIWGSTYLAILIGIESMPPFLMAGIRFVVAGLPVYAWARLAPSSSATPGSRPASAPVA